jgi:hypothetical protein
MTSKIIANLAFYVLVAGIFFLLIALLLIRLSWFPRRRGDTLHCKRCNYNLQGLTSDRCPECGQYLSPKNIIKGQRHRRPSTAVFALLLLLVGITGIAAGLNERIRKTDWYTYKPTSWVFADLKSADQSLYDRAWKEIQSRLQAKKISLLEQSQLYQSAVDALAKTSPGAKEELLQYLKENFKDLNSSQGDFTLNRILNETQITTSGLDATNAARIADLDNWNLLSTSQDNQLIEFALRSQAAPQTTLNFQWFINLLGDRALRDKLSPAQRERFFDQAMSITLAARADTLAGEPLPYEIKIAGIGPESGWQSSQRLVSLAIDGQLRDDGWFSRSGPLMNDTMPFTLKIDKPGKHTLRLVVQGAAFHSQVDWTALGKPIWSKTFDLSASFTVLPPSTSAYIELQSDPAMAALLRKAFTFQQDTEASEECIHLKITDSPANIAFDIFVRAEGKEYPFGNITAAARQSREVLLTAPKDFPIDPPHKPVEIIFRTNPSLARQTLDLHKIWQGELIIADVNLVYPKMANRR